MANTRFQHKRSSVSGVVPTTSDIAAGEIGLNLADRKAFTSNGSAVFELGANLTNLSVSANLTIGASGDLVFTNGAGLFANGTLGDSGQVLTSNGTGVYWSNSSGGVTSVNTGSGLTGGPITTTGTISVLANNGITANSTGLFVTQGTGTVVNATGVHVNSSYIGTLTANNSTNLNGQPASFYTNASNITTGTLPNAQLGANVTNTSANFTITGVRTHQANIIVGNTTVNTQFSNSTILISNATSTTTLGLTDLRIGNTTTNVIIANTTSTFGGNVSITGSANAANVTAALFTGNVTGTASNATNLNSQPGSFYTNATNLATGTVPTARLATGTANSTTFLRGDQTWATPAGGSSLAGGELFNINVSNATGYAVTTTMAAAFTAPSTAGLEYIVHSIQVTNIGAANATISGEFSGTTYANTSFALTIPVPVESAVELLKMPKVLQPSDILRLQASANSVLHSYITIETISSTAFFGSGVDVTADATFTDLYTATGNSVVTSLLLSNDDGVNDVKARVVWTDGSNVIQGYLCYDLIVPADSTVELLEKVKFLPSGHKIRVYANVGGRLEAIIAGRTL